MSTLKNILIGISVAIALTLSLACYADVAVNGYYRKNGTYVQPHMRSNPDSSFRNNWSTVGNINPYTGEKGTKTTPTYSTNSLRGSSLTGNTSYASQPSRLYDKNNESAINYKIFAQPHNPQFKASSLIELRDYETIQLENTTKIRIDNIDWYQMAKSKNDIAYVRRGAREYFNNYPTISIMYKGASQLNGKPTWLGKRFIKVIIDCEKDRIALVADATVTSNGKVLSDVDYPRNGRINWSSISDSFDTDLFKSTSEACIL